MFLRGSILLFLLTGAVPLAAQPQRSEEVRPEWLREPRQYAHAEIGFTAGLGYGIRILPRTAVGITARAGLLEGGVNDDDFARIVRFSGGVTYRLPLHIWVLPNEHGEPSPGTLSALVGAGVAVQRCGPGREIAAPCPETWRAGPTYHAGLRMHFGETGAFFQTLLEVGYGGLRPAPALYPGLAVGITR